MKVHKILALAAVFSLVLSQKPLAADHDDSRNILRQGLLGAGVGAISASASGGKAGKGALIGAGTSVLGNALLNAFSGPKQSHVQYGQPPGPDYGQQGPSGYYPVQGQQGYSQQPGGYYAASPPAEDPNTKILKQGLLGAGVGAISASASGGKAGKGALIGAGTNVIGGALLDMLSGSGQSRQQAPPPGYYQQQGGYYPGQGQYQNQNQPPSQKRIIRKYDENGNLISEEEIYE